MDIFFRWVAALIAAASLGPQYLTNVCIIGAEKFSPGFGRLLNFILCLGVLGGVPLFIYSVEKENYAHIITLFFIYFVLIAEVILIFIAYENYIKIKKTENRTVILI